MDSMKHAIRCGLDMTRRIGSIIKIINSTRKRNVKGQ